MACYVDTSVWVALLGREATAPRVARWMAQGLFMVTAQWTSVEVASALGIKARRGELTQEMVSGICQAFRKLMAMGGVSMEVNERTDFQEAALLCEQVSHGLRAGDALHLAVAQRVGCTHFLSFDKALNRQAEQMGFELVALS